MEDSKDFIFRQVQKFLKVNPLVIWGSGATVPFGLPTMKQLGEHLKEKIQEFKDSSENLEKELEKKKYEPIFPKIREEIWKAIEEKERNVLEKILTNDTSEFEPAKKMIDKIRDSHPRCATLITTNYDRVLEYILSYYSIPFTDGTNGKLLSSFTEDAFMEKDIVNIFKVHGSLGWCRLKNNDLVRTFDLQKKSGDDMTQLEPVIIPPGKNKYLTAYSSPYRELVQLSDRFIKKAGSFLVIGFGFNDDHLTPKLRSAIQERPIVLVTKTITDKSRDFLKNAVKFASFEEACHGQTKVKILKEGKILCEEVLEGEYWRLSNFVEVF